MPRHECFYDIGLRELCFDQSSPDELGLPRFENWLQVDRFQIAALFGEVSALIKNVSDAATHSGGKISAARSEHQYQAFCHVFATVVANTLDHCGRSGI